MKRLKRRKTMICAVLVAVLLLTAGCGGKGQTAGPGIADGTYTAKFTTDSPMFHVNDAYEDRGILSVEDGRMTIHVSLQSKKIVKLCPGTAEEAQKDGAEILEPTTDRVTYSDGYEDEVYGFDVPVPALGEEFDLALLGAKGKWYDHKVVVTDPVEGDDIAAAIGGGPDKEAVTPKELGLADGEHTAEVSLDGGTGRASVESPAVIRMDGDECTAVIKWSSPYYDYMIVDGKRYEPVNTEGSSVFEIPVPYFDSPVEVVADTTAMSEAHEIGYTLTFDSSSLK